MQNVTLLDFADDLTRSASFVGLITFAQLGPILFLSPVGGVVADRLDRKVMMIGAAAVQAMLSGVLAFVASFDEPSEVAVVLCVLGIGIAGAANAPAAQATLPELVGRRDLPGAVALNSAQMNVSRVLGPVIAILPFLQSPTNVFMVNAATYLFVIAAVATADFDGSPKGRTDEDRVWVRLKVGILAARGNDVVRRVLVTVSIYSLCSLTFIYQMKGFARVELGVPEDRFTLLFGSFGLGAAIGAMVVGTVLGTLPRGLVTRGGLVGFAISLTVFSLLRTPVPAYPTVASCGFFYFLVITSLSTALQEAVEDPVRGRVMGLWMMGWAGLVPVGSLIAGVVIDATGNTPVLLFGAAVALALAAYADTSVRPALRTD